MNEIAAILFALCSLDTYTSNAQYPIIYTKENMTHLAYHHPSTDDSDRCTVDSVIVSINNIRIQKIIVPPNAQPCYAMNNDLVGFEDWNFDGYNDMSIFESMGGVNSSDFYWLFDAKKQKYVRNKSMEKELISAQLDSAHKTIITSWRSNAANYGKAKYEWKKDKLTLIEIKLTSYKEENDELYIIFTIQKPINGTLKVFSQKKVKSSDVKEEDSVW